MNALRLYAPEELAKDGYPPEWHKEPGIKHLVRAEAEHRCVRCLHPYTKETAGPKGEWSPCDERCTHAGPYRCRGEASEWTHYDYEAEIGGAVAGAMVAQSFMVEARWRILTVHHLDGVKANCRWWNLAALCQRCHLTIQGRVKMERTWPWEHTDWFKPYVAGFYALSYLGEDLTRAQVDERLDELLALERVG
jgi:5-methylcytosine-specific restriction endonuclease McrA